MSEKPKPPDHLREGGLRLWTTITGEYDLEEHELVLLRAAARTVDLCDDLEGRIRREGSVIQSPQGMKAHPATVEIRQQHIALARLMAALRMPSGDEGDQLPGRRPQRRSGARGIYALGSAG